jgi:two-component system, OmpR family, sensor kinase
MSQQARWGLRRRVVLATVAWSLAAMLLLLLALFVILEHQVNASLESTLDDRIAEASTRLAAAPDPTRAGLDRIAGEVALVDAKGRVVDGALPDDLLPEAARLATAGAPAQEEYAEEYLVRYEPRDDGTGLVAAELSAPYERAEHLALGAAAGLAAITVLGTAAVAGWATGRALVPVRAMAAAADEWSDGEPGRRFGAGEGPEELAVLGATLDRLLVRVERALLAERRLTSEVAHELRTPLSAVRGAAELALARGGHDDGTRTDLEEVVAGCDRMAAAITALVDLARHPESRHGPATVADLLARLDLRAVEVDAEPGLVLDVGADLAARAVDPVLSNARRHAVSTVRVEVRRDGEHVVVAVLDDGPGFAEGSPVTGTGLGLPLARRLARTAGGDVVVVAPDADGAGATEGPGARVEVRLPSA